jgi:hypothetical protein
LGELNRKVFLSWKKHTQFVKRETRRLRALRIARTKAESMAHQREKRLISSAFTAWEQRVVDWIKKDSIARDCDYYYELTSMKRVVRRLRVLLAKRRKRELAISFLGERNSYKLELLFLEWRGVVTSSKDAVAALKVRNVFRKFRVNVKDQIRVNEKVSSMIVRHGSTLLKAHFISWALLVAGRKAKLRAMFKLIKKGWKEVGMKRLKGGPNIVGGVAMLKIGTKCDAKWSLRMGFLAMKVSFRNGKVFDLLTSSVERRILKLAFSSWEDVTDVALVNYEKCRIGINLWRGFVEAKERDHHKYALKRLQRSALYKWNRNIGELRADKMRRLEIADKVDCHLQRKEQERMKGAFFKFLSFVSGRVKSEHLIEVADEHHAVKNMSVGFRALRASAASSRRRREGKDKAFAHHREGLLRRCFAAIRVASVSMSASSRGAAAAIAAVDTTSAASPTVLTDKLERGEGGLLLTSTSTSSKMSIREL